MAFYKSNSCKIGPCSFSSRFNSSSFLPSLFSQPKGPKPGWMQLLCGAAGLQRKLTASNYVQAPLTPPETLQLSTIGSQTMKEFWFFNFSSSFICCLRNNILQRRQKQCLFQYMLRCACLHGLTSAHAALLGFHRLWPKIADFWARCSSQTNRCSP